jgi:1,4-dihydroxy-6-naphthoate synthase
MKLTIGFSPCPNDTFIFDALVNHKIDTEGFEFDTQLEDVQTLNQWAKEGRLDITKLSYGVLPLVLDKYVLLNSGGALGKGVGPLLISNAPLEGTPQQIEESVNQSTIAIPGENTTAHFLFSLVYPNAKNKVFLRFDEIEDFVLTNGKSKPALGHPSSLRGEGTGVRGVIIHENRFTYMDKGLHKIIDLGDYWEQTTDNPIPLGGIVIKREHPFASKIDGLIRKSLDYAFAHYPSITGYVKHHSQEMSEAVMRQHIDLYVNNYSLDLGNKGKAAVSKLLEVYSAVTGGQPVSPADTFI